jgi:hypothetical protein
VRDPLKFKKHSQPFIATNDKSFPVVAVGVSNENGSTVGINRGDAAPSPTGLAELVRNYFPMFSRDSVRETSFRRFRRTTLEGYKKNLSVRR